VIAEIRVDSRVVELTVSAYPQAYSRGWGGRRSVPSRGIHREAHSGGGSGVFGSGPILEYTQGG